MSKKQGTKSESRPSGREGERQSTEQSGASAAVDPVTQTSEPWDGDEGAEQFVENPSQNPRRLPHTAIADELRLDEHLVEVTLQRMGVEPVDTDERGPLFDADRAVRAIGRYADILAAEREALVAEIAEEIEAKVRAKIKAEGTPAAGEGVIDLGVALAVDPFVPPKISTNPVATLSKETAKAELDAIDAAKDRARAAGEHMAALRRAGRTAEQTIQVAIRRASGVKASAGAFHRQMAVRASALREYLEA